MSEPQINDSFRTGAAESGANLQISWLDLEPLPGNTGTIDQHQQHVQVADTRGSFRSMANTVWDAHFPSAVNRLNERLGANHAQSDSFRGWLGETGRFFQRDANLNAFQKIMGMEGAEDLAQLRANLIARGYVPVIAPAQPASGDVGLWYNPANPVRSLAGFISADGRTMVSPSRTMTGAHDIDDSTLDSLRRSGRLEIFRRR